MTSCLYRIICRKRSDSLEWGHPNLIYWMPNRGGYTDDITKAGLYTALELDDCAGYGFDWFAERVRN